LRDRTPRSILVLLFFSCAWIPQKALTASALVLMTDFGTQDGAVASMKGVAVSVSWTLPIFDLTHEIEPYNIWEGACRLDQTVTYWPKGTVFVCVVDPGVGTERRSIVLETRKGHLLVTPDNGTATLVAQNQGISRVFQIDEKRHGLEGSRDSHTFHGRDLYVFVGARLAAGILDITEVGDPCHEEIVLLPYPKASWENGRLQGGVPVLDSRYGNIWTNIDQALVHEAGIELQDLLQVQIFRENLLVYEGKMPFVRTFADVEEGFPLAYLNSLLHLSFAINMDSFAQTHNISSGPSWRVHVKPIR